MDYLDPIKKRTKKNRLMVMYSLLGVAIAIATMVIVYLVNGYYIDGKTGEVIQNGLIYVDSKPESAEIFLNGEKQRGRTDARLVVPEGTYTIELNRDGYRNWARELVLEGGSLRRLSYARLVPENLDSETALSLPARPQLVTQSIDKRWMLFAFEDNPLRWGLVDLQRPVAQLVDVELSPELLGGASGGVWKVLDWSEDNKTFLASYTAGEDIRYVLIDREDARRSVDVSALFPDINPSTVELKARRNDQLYLFDKTAKRLFQANVDDRELTPVLQDVIDFRSYDDDAILYLTDKDAPEGMVSAFLKKGDDTYKLRDIKAHSSYLLDISKLGNALVMGIASPAENRAIIYNDPINALKENDFSTLPVPTTVMRVNQPVELTISADSSIILLHSATEFASHEFDADRSYSFSLEKPIDSRLRSVHWIDGQHFTYIVEGMQYMIDFDGSNRYQLVGSQQPLDAIFDAALDELFSVVTPSTEGQDFTLQRTFMRTAADR